jgi:hypothetical protein
MKIKKVKIGDKILDVVDSYSYEVTNQENKKERFTDLYVHNDEGVKEFVKTVRDNDYDYENDNSFIVVHLPSIKKFLNSMDTYVSDKEYAVVETDRGKMPLWWSKDKDRASLLTQKEADSIISKQKLSEMGEEYYGIFDTRTNSYSKILFKEWIMPAKEVSKSIYEKQSKQTLS